ncbi:MAG: NADH-quinone oxidoreductase subunit H [Leptospiraceae bacterium]|nr:NADH-quinone oxidoreductase subunit H [Leptospiraceae bacterium]MCK6380660.1 NADH-quinone oxidoreductase subunit H [Leptospiraceae bacterium]NUM41526.1 NADH-quinone oxidoreductase subunit H [Leptospiraceae bacterium]
MAHIFISIISFCLLPVFLGGIIRKVRSRAQGRKGPPVLQNFYDILRPFGKEPIDGFSSGIFSEIAPVTAFFSAVILWSLVCFEWGSFILIPSFLLLQRFCVMAFAMETGTSFGGLGTKREILLSITTEPILFLMILVAESHLQVEPSFTIIATGLIFLVVSGIAILVELTKPPFDDPRTHLELTMVHEAMILEASGKSLAYFEAANQVKIAALLAFLVKLGIKHSKFMIPQEMIEGVEMVYVSVGTIFFAGVIGWWESVSVRRKWVWIPEIMGLTFLFILLLGTLVKLK